MPNESLAVIPFRQPLLSACATHRPKIGRYPLSFTLRAINQMLSSQ
jgi:hypothetical protein